MTIFAILSDISFDISLLFSVPLALVVGALVALKYAQKRCCVIDEA